VKPIEVLELISRLESLLNSGTRFPFTTKVAIDEKEFLEIIDNLHVAMPEEVRQAKRIRNDKDRLLIEAQAEAEKVLADAHQHASTLLNDNEILRTAQQQAETIVAEATQQAAEIREGADEYVLSIFGGLEAELTRLVAIVRKGRTSLETASRRTSVTSPRRTSKRPTESGDDYIESSDDTIS
jgi:hypothetical protein